MKTKVLVFAYLVVLVCLFLYSFTQIDLSLTFSKNAFAASLVKSFQHIGYFNRPLSGALYLGLIITLFSFYGLFLYLVHKKKLQKKIVWSLLIGATAILAFSYNAFSYDLFNYIFDAKIITHYQQNPYEHKALDYAGDPMLSFMRWTHRVYPYGPVWLGLTVPLSFLGLQLFVPTLFLFKIFMAAGFIGSLFFLGKILRKIAPEKELFGLVFFGLNPLVLIESLVSAHIDIVMVFFCLWSFYLLVKEKYVVSFILFFLSIGIKFATGFLLPIYLWLFMQQKKKKKVSWQRVILFSLGLLLSTVLIASLRSTFQPWYLVLVLAFASLLASKYYVFVPSIILSFGAMLTYVPYLFIGNWDPPIPQNLTTLYLTTCVIAVVGVVSIFFARRFNKGI